MGKNLVEERKTLIVEGSFGTLYKNTVVEDEMLGQTQRLEGSLTAEEAAALQNGLAGTDGDG